MVEDHQYFRKVIQHREHFRKLFVRVILFDESQVEKSFRELDRTILRKIVNTYVKESIVEWNCPFERDRSSRGFGLSIHLKLSLIHISEPTRLLSISYAVFCLKK